MLSDNTIDFALLENDENGEDILDTGHGPNKKGPDAPNFSSSVYYNLIENPERYTGYSGKDAQRIWHAIYLENCHYVYGGFNRSTGSQEDEKHDIFINTDANNESNSVFEAPKSVCPERTIFYRIISGN